LPLIGLAFIDAEGLEWPGDRPKFLGRKELEDDHVPEHEYWQRVEGNDENQKGPVPTAQLCRNDSDDPAHSKTEPEITTPPNWPDVLGTIGTVEWDGTDDVRRQNAVALWTLAYAV